MPHAELLSPAGNWTCLRAAVENGADAVYFGVESFNARARAENFRTEEMPQIMLYLRQRGVRGYLTLNVLIFAHELDEAAQILLAASQAGVDAVLVQDIGIARLAQQLVPDLPIHASTQMTVTDPAAMTELQELGLQRFVVPREFSVTDIERTHKHTGVELEAFVHGALCVAWSGQCLTSESFGGRSANRGQCAQACRQPYDMYVDGTRHDLGPRRYLLSPLDLAGIEMLPALLAAGVVCFKIEGRLKTPEYVANITRHYRRALDDALRGHDVHLPRDAWREIAQSFSRGLTHGYLDGINHQTLVPGLFPKSRGVWIGTVARVDPPHVFLRDCEAPLQPGDGIVFDNGDPERREPGGAVYQVASQGEWTQIGLAHDLRWRDIRVGDKVWKTSDLRLNQQLRASFESDTRTMPLQIRVEGRAGEPLRVHAHCGSHSARVESSELLEPARNKPLDDAILYEKLGRFGDTHYRLESLQLEIDGMLALPVSALNRLRRTLTDRLDQAFAQPQPRRVNPAALAELRKPGLTSASGETELSAFCRSEAQVRAACAVGVARIYADFEDPRGFRGSVAVARTAGIPVYLATPRIVKPGEEGFFRKLASYEPDGVLVRNLGGLLYYRQNHPQLDLIGDFSLNCANDLSAREYLSRGLRLITPSYDLNAEQLDGMLTRVPADRFELVLHQYMPMFHMEHCVFAAGLSTGRDYRDCGRPCESHAVELRDHTGAMLPVQADVGCRNTVFHGAAQSGALYLDRFRARGMRRFRVEFLTDSAERVSELLGTYRRLLTGELTPRAAWSILRATERLGVTRGTLDR